MIDFRKLIEDIGLDKMEVAKQLFPHNKHYMMALTRVMDGKAVLDADQMGKLAMLAGVDVSDLYFNGWKSVPSDVKENKNLLSLSNGDFLAVLDIKKFQTRLFHKKSLFYEEIIHSEAITLSDYIKKLNSEIFKFKKYGR